MPTDHAGTIVTAVIAGAGAIGSVIVLLLRKIIIYLFDRITTLEMREHEILSKIPLALESQQDTLQVTADYVRQVNEDTRYQRRRLVEGGTP